MWKGILIIHNTNFSRLRDVHFDLTANLIEKLCDYFPENPLEIFSILNSKEWNDGMDNDNLGQEQ